MNYHLLFGLHILLSLLRRHNLSSLLLHTFDIYNVQGNLC